MFLTIYSLTHQSLKTKLKRKLFCIPTTEISFTFLMRKFSNGKGYIVSVYVQLFYCLGDFICPLRKIISVWCVLIYKMKLFVYLYTFLTFFWIKYLCLDSTDTHRMTIALDIRTCLCNVYVLFMCNFSGENLLQLYIRQYENIYFKVFNFFRFTANA